MFSYTNKRMWILWASAILIIFMTSCKKYLEAKSDAKLTVPSTIQDLQALLDNSATMNNLYPSSLQIATDEYYLADNRYNNMTPIQAKNVYIWASDSYYNTAWNQGFQAIYVANTVLDYVGKVKGSQTEINYVKGSALFYRAFNLHQLAQAFCPGYSSSSSSTDLGLPLRTSADFNQPSIRASLEQTYQQIITDYKTAASLLNDQQTSNFRPTKVAAYAGLARTYLVMNKFQEAKEAANNYLQSRSILMDLNNFTANQIIARNNVETIFRAIAPGPGALDPSQAMIDSNLIALYSPNDLRLKFFYRKNANNTYGFIGGYDGSSPSNIIFEGLATDEAILIRAECHAREQNTTEAMKDVNTLRRNRYSSPYTDTTAANAADALKIVLNERRKELVYRGLRWSDLKRLNREPAFQVTLKRSVNGTQYTLPPNDNRYALLLPEDVIRLSGMQQNKR